MPNWCVNKVELFGDDLIIEELLRLVRENAAENVDENGLHQYSPLQTFVPMSEYHKSQSGYNDGGYEWALENWGTKWPESYIEIEANLISFDSPWGPPIIGYAKISKKFPQLFITHFYDEPGMCYMGSVVYHNGEIVFEEELAGDQYPYYDGNDDEGYFASQMKAMDSLRDSADRYVMNALANR